MEEMVGVIIAGGKSRRFGSPKAFAKRNGHSFYHYSLQVIKPLASTTILVTNSSLFNQFNRIESSIEVVKDVEQFQGGGPLAGIYTAMEKVHSKWYIVVPVDVPFIETWVFERLIANCDQDYDAIIPVVDGRIQPLIAIYKYTLKAKIAAQLSKENKSVRQVFKKSKVKYVHFEDEKPFININNEQDYQTYIDNSL